MLCQDEHHEGEFWALEGRKRYCSKCAIRRKREKDNIRVRKSRARFGEIKTRCICNLCGLEFKEELGYPYFGTVPRPTSHVHCPDCYRIDIEDVLVYAEPWEQNMKYGSRKAL